MNHWACPDVLLCRQSQVRWSNKTSSMLLSPSMADELYDSTIHEEAPPPQSLQKSLLHLSPAIGIAGLAIGWGRGSSIAILGSWVVGGWWRGRVGIGGSRHGGWGPSIHHCDWWLLGCHSLSWLGSRSGSSGGLDLWLKAQRHTDQAMLLAALAADHWQLLAVTATGTRLGQVANDTANAVIAHCRQQW